MTALKTTGTAYLLLWLIELIHLKTYSTETRMIHRPEPTPKQKSRVVPERYQQRPASQRKAKFIAFTCCEWKSQAGKLSKSAIRAGEVIWYAAGLEKDKFMKEGKTESKPLKLHAHLRKHLDVSPWQMSRGITALEKAGLVRRLETRPGKLQEVASH
jgi:hypothetical protein